MKKIKLLFAACAAFTGIGGAIASNIQTSASPAFVHDWVDLDNVTILVNQTQEQAQTMCSGTLGICLKAKDNVNITTHGILR